MQKEISKMFVEEERLLDESHRQTVERHEEIMALIEQVSRNRNSCTSATERS